MNNIIKGNIVIHNIFTHWGKGEVKQIRQVNKLHKEYKIKWQGQNGKTYENWHNISDFKLFSKDL